MIAEVFIKNFW